MKAVIHDIQHKSKLKLRLLLTDEVISSRSKAGNVSPNHQLIFPSVDILNRALAVFSCWLDPQGKPVFVPSNISENLRSPVKSNLGQSITSNFDLRHMLNRKAAVIEQMHGQSRGPVTREPRHGLFIKKSNISKARNLLFKAKFENDCSGPNLEVEDLSSPAAKATRVPEKSPPPEVEELDFAKVMEEAQKMIGVSNWQRTESARKKKQEIESRSPEESEYIKNDFSAKMCDLDDKVSKKRIKDKDSDSESSSEVIINIPNRKKTLVLPSQSPKSFKAKPSHQFIKDMPINFKLESKISFHRPVNIQAFKPLDAKKNISVSKSMLRTPLKRPSINNYSDLDQVKECRISNIGTQKTHGMISSQNLRKKISIDKSRLTTYSNADVAIPIKQDDTRPMASRIHERPIIFRPSYISN